MARRHFSIRAKEFLTEFLPYVKDPTSSYSISKAVRKYNEDHHRSIACYSGASRTAVVCYDYVVKFETGDPNYFGGNISEYNTYLNALRNGYGEFFAEMRKVEVNNKTYYCMQRIAKTQYYAKKPDWYNNIHALNAEASYWIAQNISDIHDGNYGMHNGHVVISDYAASQWKSSTKSARYSSYTTFDYSY